MRTERIQFPGSQNAALDARLDQPDTSPRFYALFAHCFTCGKDIFAANRIAQALTQHGIAVLRFDFTGIGASDGEFENTNFSSNIADLIAAADHLREHFQAPELAIGHSLGGAAVLAAAHAVPELKALATLAAPSDPAHVTRLFKSEIDKINSEGEAEVQLAGKSFRVKRQFLEDVKQNSLTQKIADLRRALLVLHSPRDITVDISNALHIFSAAKHPKSFVSLDEADHILSRRQDAVYAADVIAVWSSRYIDQHQRA